MSEENISRATNSIKKKIPEFNYDLVLKKLVDKDVMQGVYHLCQSDYEKLQVFRIINDKHESSIVRKYINEAFHIENEYICQLNPCKYEIIPEFIVKECDGYFNVT